MTCVILISSSLVTVSEVHHRSSGSSNSSSGKHRSHHTSIAATPLSPRDNTQHIHHHHKSKSKSVGGTVATVDHTATSPTTLNSNGVHSSHSTPRLSGTGATTASSNSNKLTPVTSTINHDNGIILKVVYKMHSKRMKLLKVSQIIVHLAKRSNHSRGIMLLLPLN